MLSASTEPWVETRLLPTLTRAYPWRFTFYVADPVSSIQGTAGDTPATTACSLMHHKPLMMDGDEGFIYDLKLARCFPRSFTLITRTARCLRQLP